MRQKVHMITLGVRDFDRALRFYRDGLGWTLSAASQGDFCAFPMGGVVLALYPLELLAGDAEPCSPGRFSGVELAHNCKSKAEVDEVLQTAREAGATDVRLAQDTAWGGYSGGFADPEGHRWEVAWNPFWPFDEQDNLIMP
jgi:catechol 2,3-dioxygenase-like lactoylglutathione lyase family enzyme